jgi:hypothetical protein
MTTIQRMRSALAAFCIMVPVKAFAGETLRTGTLTCRISGGLGAVVISQKPVFCRYQSIRGWRQLYTGTINKFGLDIGVTTGGHLVWAVFEPAIRPGGIEGVYSGATAEVTIGAGLGANVLIGGGNGGVALQPLSVQEQAGLNLAAGVMTMTLDVVPEEAEILNKHRHHHRKRHHRG